MFNHNIKIQDIAEEERPREKLMHKGVNALSNGELLAIIISAGTKNESALDLAIKILAMENSLAHFSNYQPEEFEKLQGIGDAIACRICAAIELGKRVMSSHADRFKLTEPNQIATLCEDMRHMQKEILRVAMFNVKSELIKTEDISMGGIAVTSAMPREIFNGAIKKGANAIVMIHNHPSGDPAPSSEDIKTTHQVYEAGKLVGIALLDHIIIGDGCYFSFLESNMLKNE